MPQPLLHAVESAADAPDAWARVQAALAAEPLALSIVLASPQAAFGDMPARLGGPGPVIGCTTAGEIGAAGYTEGSILGIGLPARDFIAETLLIEDLSALDGEAIISALIRRRTALSRARPDWEHEFAFLLVDGLSNREDALAALLATGLGPVPLFGGSAADGTRFLETRVLHGAGGGNGAGTGQAAPVGWHRNAAVLALVRTRCPIRVFKSDHLRPTATRMVVTAADPDRRIVHRINAEPAALEYARLLGKDPAQLTPFTFAAHPVVVRIGGRHHVRAIRQVADNGDLIFYSAIGEGMVLTLAEPQDMAAHLRTVLDGLARDGAQGGAPRGAGAQAQHGRGQAPGAILACDCVLRRMEAQEKQATRAVSELLGAHGVLGFSTYGEQFNAMHVNQTLTGVAIYPPPLPG
ncbi:MAG: FIST C-terminal domain-containing protein [Rhodobacteraceae bacterium]|nr:FIST C-terminal domain-containing protein [Paracoccaceae bacterium]